LKITIKLIEHDSEYIANCPELDINCYGENKREAVKRLIYVLQFYIESAKDLGLDVDQFDEVAVDGEFSVVKSEAYCQKSNSIN
jgi:hypothetical protein